MKKFLIYLLFFFSQFGFSQQNQLWEGYFSYNEIKDLSESPTRIFAAAENALFSKDLNTNDIKTTNTINGLSGQTITTIYHSPTFNKTIVGYETGLMIVINEIDGSMLNVVDIINKSIPSNIKRINHFMEYDGIVYVSCDFGIVQYKLATLEFGDTYFIGPAGAEIKVYQTAVFNNDIYAVTQNNGIRKATITNPNLNDFAQWQLFDGGFWNGIVSFSNQLIGMNTNGRVYKHNGTFFTEFGNILQNGLDIRTNDGELIVTTLNHVFIYNQNLSQIVHLQNFQITEIPVTFSCATVINDIIYIGTNENGIVSSTIANPTGLQFIMPNGPSRNSIFSINTSSSTIWAVYGDYTTQYDPAPLLYKGISKYSNNQWLNIPYTDVHFSGSETPDLVRVTVNPTNENQIFISSYFSGLLVFDNDVLTTVYNETNSGLESIFPTDPADANLRIEQSAFDKAGNLWMTNGLVANGIKELKANGQWQSYSVTSIINSFFDARLGKMVIDRNGTKWICTTSDGVIAFNENGNVYKKITFGDELGNLPIEDARCLAIDNRSQLWIGTRKGLRVLPSIGSFNNEEQMKANAIIILENDLAQELLYEQFVTDIVVDGSNRKWIGTADSGVFLFSSNGQETIYHFTKDNSPLPSDVIRDIDINDVTGEVFFVTQKGMVSFKGTSTKPSDSLSDAYVYPNPVRPEFFGTVKIAGLIANANIKITDIEGNLVYETTSIGGTVEWDTTAFGKYKVASGVYMIFIAADDASDTTVKKVMIIR